MARSAADTGVPRVSAPSATVARRMRFIVSPCRIVDVRQRSARAAASEVDDDVRRSDEGGILVRSDAEVRVAVEGRRIQRSVEGEFGPDLDLRREPVLPAQPGL